jgi:hypothetical protein
MSHQPHLIPVTKRDSKGVDRTYHVRPDSPRHKFDARAVRNPASASFASDVDRDGREHVEILAENLQRPPREPRGGCSLGALLARLFTMGTKGGERR